MDENATTTVVDSTLFVMNFLQSNSTNKSVTMELNYIIAGKNLSLLGEEGWALLERV